MFVCNIGIETQKKFNPYHSIIRERDPFVIKIVFNTFLIMLLMGCSTPSKTDSVERVEKSKSVKQQSDAIASGNSSNLTGAAPKVILGPAVGAPMREAKILLTSGNAQAALEKINQAEAIPYKTLVEEKVIYQYKMAALMDLRDSDAVETMVNTQRSYINPNQWGDILKFLHAGFALKRNYPKAVFYGEKYLVEVQMDFDVLEMVARSYYMQGNYQAASNRIKELIRQIERSGKTPEKEIYEVWLAISYKLNDSSGIKNAKEKILKLSSTNEK